MQNEISHSVYFGLGILLQAVFFIGNKFKKNDIKEILKDIGGGLLFVFFALYGFGLDSEPISRADLYTAVSYCFFVGFGAAFAFSFRKRILTGTNEIALLALNTVFLYYLITRIGLLHWLTIFFYLPTITCLIFFLFRFQFKYFHKAFLAIWHAILVIVTALINFFSRGGTETSLNFSGLFSGSIFLYVFVFIVFLIMLIPMEKGYGWKNSAEEEEREESGFLAFASSFEKSKTNPLLTVAVFSILIFILLFNSQYKYFSEKSLIAFVIFTSLIISTISVNPIILKNIKSKA